MSDFSIRSLAGANPAPPVRPTPPEPPTVQQAVAQPLTDPQSSVTQSPSAGNAQWQNRRNSNTDVQQRQDLAAQQQLGATPTREQMQDAVDSMNQFLRHFDTNLQFDMDSQYGEMVVRIVDRQTKEVIRQIPSEEALAIAKSFKTLENEQSQSQPESSSGSPASDSQRLKVEGLLLNAKV